jgi:MGT family glycosyltransferase
MRILVLVLPAAGHINPTLAIVRELTLRGHEVVYYSTADFAEKITSTGAQFRPYPDIVIKDKQFDPRTPSDNMIRLSLDLLLIAEFLYDCLLPELVAEKWDLLFYDTVTPWGRFLGKELKLKTVVSIPTFAFNVRVTRLDFLFRWFLKLIFTSLHWLIVYEFHATRLRFIKKWNGLSLLELLTSHTDTNLVYTSRTFQPFEKDFDSRFHFIGTSLPKVLPHPTFPFHLIREAKKQNRPIFLISLGTLYNERFSFYQSCIRSHLKWLEKSSGPFPLVILSVGQKTNLETLGKLPEGLLAFNDIPQIELLPLVDVFLSHGGMNSTSESLRFGVPISFFPQIDEQRIVAKRTEVLGAGLLLTKKSIEKSEIIDSMMAIFLEPSYRFNAQKIGEALIIGESDKRGASLIEAALPQF